LADCSNTEGGFTCTCQIGHTGDGYNCTGKLNISYNTVWSGIHECNERMPLLTVL